MLHFFSCITLVYLLKYIVIAENVRSERLNVLDFNQLDDCVFSAILETTLSFPETSSLDADQQNRRSWGRGLV